MVLFFNLLLIRQEDHDTEFRHCLTFTNKISNSCQWNWNDDLLLMTDSTLNSISLQTQQSADAELLTGTVLSL